MTLYDILKKADFDKVFSDILCHMPDVEEKRSHFKLVFESLRSSTPSKDSCLEIDPVEKDYLGEGVHDLWVNGCSTGSDFVENLLASPIQWSPHFNSPDAGRKITNEMVIADLLWLFVAYGFPDESAFLPGLILNNTYHQEFSRIENIEGICRYIDLHKVTGLSHAEIQKFNKAKNLAWFTNITSYSLPQIKAAYDTICFLDDNMWFNLETRTVVIISSSAGYENEVCEIKEFAKTMLKNPLIAYGKPLLPGIEASAIFITE